MLHLLTNRLVHGQRENITGFTAAYAAPEVYGPVLASNMVSEVDKKVDVFAYAISTYELLHRKNPWSCIEGTESGDAKARYPSAEDIKRFILSGLRPKLDGENECAFPKIVNVIVRGWDKMTANK